MEFTAQTIITFSFLFFIITALYTVFIVLNKTIDVKPHEKAPKNVKGYLRYLPEGIIGAIILIRTLYDMLTNQFAESGKYLEIIFENKFYFWSLVTVYVLYRIAVILFKLKK